MHLKGGSSKIHFFARWLTGVVDLNALDQGLHILSLTQDVDNDAIFKRASKRPKLA